MIEVPANQPCGILIPTAEFDQGYFGLQLDPEATNFCLWSDDYSKWTNLHATVAATGLPDPLGGKTAWDIASLSGYSGLISQTVLTYKDPTNPIICLSGWMNNAGPDPSNGLIAVLGTNGDMTTGWAGLPYKNQQGYGQGWTRFWYIDNYDYGVLYTEIGNRPEFQVEDTRAQYFGIQVENTAYPTSFIHTQDVPVTREKEQLSFTPYRADGTFDIEVTFGMSLSTYWQTGFTILADATGTKKITFNSNNHTAQIVSVIGDTVTDSAQLTWDDSDRLTCRVVVDGPNKTYTVTVSKNGVIYHVFTAVHSVQFNFGNLVFIGSNPDGSNYVPVDGLISVWETVH
jgi:hypothetical protein